MWLVDKSRTMTWASESDLRPLIGKRVKVTLKHSYCRKMTGTLGRKPMSHLLTCDGGVFPFSSVKSVHIL